MRTAEWLDGGRDRSFLLRGSDLSSAEAWLARQDEHAERATAEQAGYIVASRQAATRRQRMTMTAVLAALAVATTLAVYALIQRGAADERARVASSRELAASALAVLPRDPELAVLLAAEGAQTRATAQAEDALRQALGESHVALTLRGHNGPVAKAVLADRDRLVITAGHDRTVRVWDARTGGGLATLRGHKDVIRGLAVSSDGSRIVSAGDDNTARIWNRANGRALAVLRGHTKPVYGPSFSPDARLVLTASQDGTARLWNARTGRPLAVLKGHDDIVFSARFDVRGDNVLTASADGTARLWSVPGGQQMAVLRGHRGWVNAAAFSPDGALIATAGQDATARIWSAATGRQRKVLRLGDRVNSVAFAPNSKRLATSSDDATAAVWNVRTGTRTAELRGHQDDVSRAVFSRSGELIVTSSDDNTARIWDSRSGEPVEALRGHSDRMAEPSLAADGTRVLTASDDGTARVWRLPQRATRMSGGDELTGAALSPDGSQVMTRGSGDVRLFDARSHRQLRSFGMPEFVADDAAFLPGGRLAVAIAGTTDRRSAEVVDTRSGRVLATMRAAAPTRAISVSRDGSRMATVGLAWAGSSSDDAVRVWDTRSGHLISRFTGKGMTLSATLSPDGSRVIRGYFANDPVSALLASRSPGGAIEAWDAIRGRLIATLAESPGTFSAASFSPDGRRVIVTTANGPAPIWDMRSSKPDRVLRPRAQSFLDNVASVDWSPSGDLVAIADRNDRGVVRVFGVARGDLRSELRHGDEVGHVAFSRDGRWLVSAGIDGIARVWDVSSGLAVTELRGHRGKVVAATFGPDARQVLTASTDGTTLLHECEACTSLRKLLKLLPRHVSAGRRLTGAERRTYLHDPG